MATARALMASPESSAERPHGAQPSHEAVRVLGIPFAALTPDDVVARVRTMLADGGSHQIVLANANTLNLARRDPVYRRALEQATLVLRDGVGVEIAARLHKQRLVHNFVGTDFVPMLLRALAAPRVGVFLYGARPGVAAEAAPALTRLGPGIDVVGVEDGYGDAEEVVRRVQAARADVLLVALGNPQQEQWIADNLARLHVRVAIGVGALFDFLAERVPRAPQWMRRARLEWVYRLYREPRRLWRRYVIGNAEFLWHVVRASRSERT